MVGASGAGRRRTPLGWLGAALLLTAGGAAAQESAHMVPMFAAASPAGAQGVVRIRNLSDDAGTVRINGFDDAGVRAGPITIAIGAGETVDLAAEALARTGASGFDRAVPHWRLAVGSTLDLQVHAYLRTPDGLLAAMHDVAPEDGGRHEVAFFNPGRNTRQVSLLRLVNPGEMAVGATIRGTDDAGGTSAAVRTTVPARGARMLTAQQLEGGAAELVGALGSGAGRWRLTVTATQPLHVMSLLASPTGHLANVSAAPGNVRREGTAFRHDVFLFPAARSAAPGFVRVINRGKDAAEIRISAFDDSNTTYPPTRLAIPAGTARHFNAADLEQGNPAKGFVGGTGAGEGPWRLQLDTSSEIEVLAYVRSPDGFVASMHDAAARAGMRHRVAIFDPAGGADRESLLRLVNTDRHAAGIAISGVDDAGLAGGTVRTTLPGLSAVTLTAADLEMGRGFTGALGTGVGKWRLTVTADAQIRVLSLMRSADGHLTNLSTVAGGGRPVFATAGGVFRTRVSGPIVQARCASCHVAGGQSAATRLVFVPASAGGHLERNRRAFEDFVARVSNGAALVLAKIAGDANHGGGEQVPMGSESYAAMRRFLSLVESNAPRRPPSEGVANVGYYNYESPHSNPLALLPDESLIYVANTPADTVDVIETATGAMVARVQVGIDPVGIAVRPDGKEVWVSNHVSDSVSVIDADPASPTRHQVLATIQDLDAATKSTRFDEPVGIAFAGNRKAYVALSSSNRIAVIDVRTRRIVRHLAITAQDPRALAVRNGRLYVVPFESNNQTQISGCWPENIDGELCTFDARRHVTEAPGGAAQSLSTGYVADIVRHPGIPDRDLYVFDTATDELLQVVDTLGTLLYGITVDSTGRVFIAQAEARNDANGKAGTRGHGLAEMENRAFLNQITTLPCEGRCGAPTRYELEPLPPAHPPKDEALATPFAIDVSADDEIVVATAAASSRLFTVDAATGEVLARVDVGAIPRGLALQNAADGSPATAWVLNALANSVSKVQLADPRNPTVAYTIPLADPADPVLRRGRIAFNDADATSTGTFACASCHPDSHTDQLLWILAAPLCDAGCDQIQPRLVQDIRGLRGSAPYHWDGTLGDPFGGVNTPNTTRHVPPNCDGEAEETCTLHLVDATLAGAMCDQSNCETNDEGKPGPLSSAERAAMSKYLLSVPYPPSPERPYTNAITAQAQTGIRTFQFEKQCGNCHRMPFWTMTNMGGSGMDVPSWRGANDRWKNAPQNRFFFADLVRGDTRGFPERFGFTSDRDMFQMILEGSVGFSGALGRQTTLNPRTARLPDTALLLDALEQAATEGGIVLQGEGVLLDADGTTHPVALEYESGAYHHAGRAFSRESLLSLAASGRALLTLTARLGPNADYARPQPTLRPHELPILPMFRGGRPADFPELYRNEPMRLRGEHIQPGAWPVVDGRRVGGSVRCEAGELPDCEDDTIFVELDDLPATPGMHLLQLQNPAGLFSNDFVFHVHAEPPRAESGNPIASGGRFNGRGDWNAALENASVTWNGAANFAIRAPNAQPWRVSLTRAVAVRAGVTYSICYTAKAADYRYIEVNIDSGPGGTRPYRSLMGTGFAPEVGAAERGTGASLNTTYHEFRHRFVPPETDVSARLTFNLAQSAADVQIDDVGLYEGRGCGVP